MKKIIFSSFFILFFLSVASVSATVAPNQLQYNFDLVVDEEKCQAVTVSSGEPREVIISDVWAPSYETGSDLNLFTYEPANHGIFIDFIDTLVFEEEGSIDVEVCVTASEVGKFKGALIFAPQEGQGNVVQYASWLRIIVEEKEVVANNNQNSNTGGSGSGGSGSGGSRVVRISDEKVEDSQSVEFEELSADIGDNQEVVEEEGVAAEEESFGKLSITNQIGFLNFIPIVFIIFIIAASVYVGKQRRKFAVN